jgi:TetR/AcrR family transcriptional repressor of nem operon
MKVTRQQAEEHRQQIVETAAQRFRARGYDGVAIAEIMAAAGLTHGGFYGHFESKDDLLAQACECAFAEKATMWRRIFQRSAGERLSVVAKRYLNEAHERDPGQGCPLPALAADAARQRGPVRRAFTKGFRALIEVLTHGVGRSATIERERAIVAWSTLTGAMMLARAVDDPQLAKEILAAAAGSLERPTT